MQSDTILYTPRLALVLPEISHDKWLFELYSNAHLLQYKDDRPHQTIEETRGFIAQIQDDNKNGSQFFRVLTHLPEGIPIGTISLYHIDYFHSFASISNLLHPDYHKQGFMSEASRVLLQFAFSTLNINRIEAQVYEHNYPMLRLAEKLNFKQEGLLRQNFNIQGEFKNSLLYSILKNDVTY